MKRLYWDLHYRLSAQLLRIAFRMDWFKLTGFVLNFTAWSYKHIGTID